MSETIGQVGPAVGTAAPERPGGLRIGRYPVVLPKLTDPRLHVSFVTTTLQILGQTVFKFNISIAQILLTFGICMSIDIATTFRRSKIFQWPASAMPTASGIALIMRVPGTEWGDWWSMNGWWVFAGTAVFAMASKHLIRVKGRHIFNPSNFALVVAFLVLGEFRADPQVLWWGPVTPGLVIAFVVILGGSVFITGRVGQGPMAVGFWVPFAVLMGVIALSGHSITANWHVGPISGWDYFWLLVISPEVLVFTFFMITDPKTTPRGRVGRLLFGISVATTAGIIIATQPREHGTKVGLLAALVVMCVFTRLIERWCPAPGSDEDRIRPWLGTILAPRRRPSTIALRWLSVAAIVVAVIGSTFVLGGRDAADAQGPELGRRDEVPVPAAIPPVEVDAGSAGSATDITADQAERMATDLVHDLEIERVAYRDADAELAQSASGRCPPRTGPCGDRRRRHRADQLLDRPAGRDLRAAATRAAVTSRAGAARHGRGRPRRRRRSAREHVRAAGQRRQPPVGHRVGRRGRTDRRTARPERRTAHRGPRRHHHDRVEPGRRSGLVP